MQLNNVTAVPPTVTTVLPFLKFAPLIVTLGASAISPLSGVMDVIVGVTDGLSLYKYCAVYFCPSLSVIIILTVPAVFALGIRKITFPVFLL